MAGFIAGIVTDLIKWAIAKGVAFISFLWQRKQREDEIDAEEKAKAEDLKKAKTDDEFDEAARRAARRP